MRNFEEAENFISDSFQELSVDHIKCIGSFLKRPLLFSWVEFIHVFNISPFSGQVVNVGYHFEEFLFNNLRELNFHQFIFFDVADEFGGDVEIILNFSKKK